MLLGVRRLFYPLLQAIEEVKILPLIGCFKDQPPSSAFNYDTIFFSRLLFSMIDGEIIVKVDHFSNLAIT